MFGYSNPCVSSLISYVLKGHRKTLSAPSKKIWVNCDTLKLLVDRFAGPKASLLDLRLVVFAVLSTAGMLRSSETMNLKLPDVVDLGSHLQVTITRSKCSTVPQHVTLAANNSQCCPVMLMRRYTNSLPGRPNSHFLAGYARILHLPCKTLQDKYGALASHARKCAKFG